MKSMAGSSRRTWLSGLMGGAWIAPRLALAQGKGQRRRGAATTLTDELTGREIERLSDPSVLHHLPHYHHRILSRSGNDMLVAAEFGGSRQIYGMRLPGGELRQITAGTGLEPYSPHMLARGRSCYLVQENELREVSLRNGSASRFYTAPEGWRLTGHLSASADDRFVVLVEMRSEDWRAKPEEQFQTQPLCRIRVVDTTQRSDWLAVEAQAWITHPQVRPGRREILFTHEGPASKVKQRLWLAPFQNGQAKPVLPRTGDEQTGAERWTPSGREVSFVHYPDATGRGATLRRLDPESGQTRELARCTRFGWYGPNSDHSAIAGASRSLAGPNIYVLFPKLNREITISEHSASLEPYPVAGTEALDYHAAEPVTFFSPDSKWVYYVSDREGTPSLYRADVSEFVEPT